MIEQFLSIASVAETTDVANNVSAAIDTAALIDDFLSRGNEKLKTLAADMVSGIGTPRIKELREKIVDADLTRDNLLSSLVKFLKAHITQGHEDAAEAAGRVLDMINSHGKRITRRSLEKESAALDSILGELKKEEFVAALTVLNLNELASELDHAQETFKALYQQSAELEAVKAQGLHLHLYAGRLLLN